MPSDLRLSTIRLPNGLTLPCAEHGDPDGTPVLLLHGYTDSWRSFEAVLPHLPRTIRAIAPTLRGHGDASKPASGYAIADFAEDVVALMDVLDLPRAVMAGHSMGSAIAERVAIDHPERVSGLVLIGGFAAMEGNSAIDALWTDAVAGFVDEVPEDFVWEFQAGTCALPVPVGLIETAVQESRKVPLRVWRAALEGLRAADHWSALGTIRAPTLLIRGRYDAIARQSDQDALLRSIPQARLLVYRESGHAPHWEEPQCVARDLAAFVADLAARHAA